MSVTRVSGSYATAPLPPAVRQVAGCCAIDCYTMLHGLRGEGGSGEVVSAGQGEGGGGEGEVELESFRSSVFCVTERSPRNNSRSRTKSDARDGATRFRTRKVEVQFLSGCSLPAE